MDIFNLLPEVLIKALSNTLLHSLWQGVVLAATAGLIIILTRKLSPVMRYNLLLGALLLFTAATVYTFAREYKDARVYDAIMNCEPHNTLTVGVDNIPFKITTEATGISGSTLMSYINNHSDVIVMIWFWVVLARSLQLATGLHGLYHLRRKDVFEVDALWQKQVDNLAVKLGIRRAVKIAESGLAKVPMVIGHLKPLILIPAGLITAMPPAEIEAILIHELAHIRRRDYLVNLLQSLVEIVFFFNPAVLWVSALVKAERENCCDDIAIAQTSSKVNYIRALVSCQEYQLQVPAYAIALSDNKSRLISRVKRMLSNNNQSLNLMEKSLLAVCLVGAGLATVAFSNAEKIDKLVVSTTKAVTKVSSVFKTGETKNDTVPLLKAGVAGKLSPVSTNIKKHVRIYRPDEVGNHTSLKINNNGADTYLLKDKNVLYQLNVNTRTDAIISMQINGTTVPADGIQAYQAAINKIKYNIDSQPTAARVEPAVPVNVRLGALVPVISNNAKVADRATPLGPLKGDLSGLREMAVADSLGQAQKLGRLPVVPEYSGRTATYRKPYNGDYKKSNDPNYIKPHDPTKEAPNQKEFADDLIKEGIIGKAEDLQSFKLSSKELIINGKKQPESVYQKYRQKYVKVKDKGEWSWFYNYDTSTDSQ